MKKINVGLAVFIVAMLGACGDPEPPEVNDENCKPENIKKWADETELPKEKIWDFSDQCQSHRLTMPEINEENCKPENIKKWGEAKGSGISMVLRARCRRKGFVVPEQGWGFGSLAPD